MTSDAGKSENGDAGTAPSRTRCAAPALADVLAPSKAAAIFIATADTVFPRPGFGSPGDGAILVGAFTVTMTDLDPGASPPAPYPVPAPACGGNASRVLGLHAPLKVLRDCGIDVARLSAEPVAVQDGEALRMLMAYLDFMRARATAASAPLADCATRHIAELLALALGGAVAARPLGPGRLRADRLGAIREAIAGHAHRPGFSIEDAGQALSLSPRYIQRLLHEEGTTFSAQVTERRLAMAIRALADPHDSLADIAFRCGFGDLSVFYRAFKRKFGTSPGRFRRL